MVEFRRAGWFGVGSGWLSVWFVWGRGRLMSSLLWVCSGLVQCGFRAGVVWVALGWV